MQVCNKFQNSFPILAFDSSAWNECHELELSEEMLPQLSVRARHVLFGGLKVKTFGELFALDVETVLGAKNAGVKTVKEILSLRNEIFNDGPGAWGRKPVATEGVEGEPAAEQPSAGDFGSLAEMMVALEGSGKEQYRSVMAQFMGLLNVNARMTLEDADGIWV